MIGIASRIITEDPDIEKETQMNAITTFVTAIAIVTFTAVAHAGMWDAADKLEAKRIQMIMAGKTEAEAKACTNAAWKAAVDHTGKGAGRFFTPSDVLVQFFAIVPECK